MTPLDSTGTNADETPPISDETPPTREGAVSISLCSVQVKSTSVSSVAVAAVASDGCIGGGGSEVNIVALSEKRGGWAVLKGAEPKLDCWRKEG
jgi:hypothetical protein